MPIFDPLPVRIAIEPGLPKNWLLGRESRAASYHYFPVRRGGQDEPNLTEAHIHS